MPSSGSVASRVASPATSKIEQPISKLAAIVAARSGGSTGTLYSSAKSCTVNSQLAILLSPALRNTLAMATRKSSWSRGSGNRPSRCSAQAIRPRAPDIGRVVVIMLCMVSSPSMWLGRAATGRRPARGPRSGLLGVLAAADELLAGAGRDVEPRVTLIVALGRAGARGIGRLAVVLAGLGDAVALLGLELGLGGRARRLRGDRHRERGGDGRGDQELRGLHVSPLSGRAR